MGITTIKLTHHKTPNIFFVNIYRYYRKNEIYIHNKLNKLKNKYAIDGIFLFLTCHRCELVLSSNQLTCEKLSENGLLVLESLFAKFLANYEKYIEIENNDKTINHLLSVSAGIDSVILGELDIIEQLDIARKTAVSNGNLDKKLDFLLNFACNNGRKLRKKYKIEKGVLSYASIPLIFLKNKNIDLGNKRFVIIGTGMLAKRFIDILHNNGIYGITILTKNVKKDYLFQKNIASNMRI